MTPGHGSNLTKHRSFDIALTILLRFHGMRNVNRNQDKQRTLFVRRKAWTVMKTHRYVGNIGRRCKHEEPSDWCGVPAKISGGYQYLIRELSSTRVPITRSRATYQIRLKLSDDLSAQMLVHLLPTKTPHGSPPPNFPPSVHAFLSTPTSASARLGDRGNSSASLTSIATRNDGSQLVLGPHFLHRLPRDPRGRYHHLRPPRSRRATREGRPAREETRTELDSFHRGLGGEDN